MGKTSPSRDKVRRYRERRRAEGFRKVEFWVPDRRNPDVLARIQAECREIANSEASAEAQSFIDSHFDDLFKDT